MIFVMNKALTHKHVVPSNVKGSEWGHKTSLTELSYVMIRAQHGEYHFHLSTESLSKGPKMDSEDGASKYNLAPDRFPRTETSKSALIEAAVS